MTRDSVLWKLLFYGGLVLAVMLEVFNALTPDMAGQLGLSPQVMAWLRIVYAIVIGVGGKLGLSWLPKKADGDTVDLKKLGTVLVLAVAIAGMAVTGCGPKPKPTLIRSDGAVYESIQALHKTAVLLGDSGVLTPAQELQVQEAILPVAKLGTSTTRVITAWKSGPTPPELVQLVKEMGTLTTRIIEILPGESKGKAQLLEKIALVQQAISVALTIVGGA